MKLNKLKTLQKQLSWFKYKCKNGCFECCGAISFLPEELKLMKKELIKNWFTSPPNWKGVWMCEYLTSEGKCSVYNARPIVCRCFSDLQFYIKKGNREVITPNCTYSKPKLVSISKEWFDYYNENLSKWILNKNAISVVNSVSDNPLINNK